MSIIYVTDSAVVPSRYSFGVRIGEYIKQLRESRGHANKSAFARQIGVDYKVLNGWEKRDVVPDPPNLLALEEKLNLTEEERKTLLQLARRPAGASGAKGAKQPPPQQLRIVELDADRPRYEIVTAVLELDRHRKPPRWSRATVSAARDLSFKVPATGLTIENVESWLDEIEATVRRIESGDRPTDDDVPEGEAPRARRKR